MNPFNTPNDSPKNPLDSMSLNGTPMNPNLSSNVPPGGRAQTGVGSPEGDRMQNAREGGQSYSVSMVYNNSSQSAKVLDRNNTPK